MSGLKIKSDDAYHQSEVDVLIGELLDMPLDELRRQWRAAHPGTIMPDRLPRDLLVRSIAWQRQCALYGGHAATTERALAKFARQLVKSGTLEIERSVKPKAGTRLVREWRGKTYVIEVGEGSFHCDGASYASLSQVARAITGTRWSGPRFFGLTGSGGEGASS